MKTNCTSLVASPSVVFVDLNTVRLAFVVLQGVKASDEQFSGDKNCRYVQLVRIFQLKKCYEWTIGQLNSTKYLHAFVLLGCL